MMYASTLKYFDVCITPRERQVTWASGKKPIEADKPGANRGSTSSEETHKYSDSRY